MPGEVTPSDPGVTPDTPPPPTEGESTSLDSNKGFLVVRLPADAKLFVNDQPMNSRGGLRRFASPELQPGRIYPYALRAQWQRNGKTVERNETIYLRAGDYKRLAISDAPQARTVDTRLTLQVPAEAAVTLAGVPTESKGTLRTFSTSRLAAGQRWKDYRVEVSIDRDGRSETQQRELELVGGESYELKFDFDSSRVAANN
jgi:uncharacterized protein (TIGR03000 family)